MIKENRWIRAAIPALLLHCSIGTDRTGVICFLINALLGVSEEDLYKDYLFSMFGMIFA